MKPKQLINLNIGLKEALTLAGFPQNDFVDTIEEKWVGYTLENLNLTPYYFINDYVADPCHGKLKPIKSLLAFIKNKFDIRYELNIEQGYFVIDKLSK